MSEGAEVRRSITFPANVYEAMQRQARRHDRSLNGEVIWALREYLKEQDDEEQREQRGRSRD